MQAMIIDDSRVTRMILGQVLKALGFEVAEANGGAEGLQGLRGRAETHLAVVDCNMPGMDGIDVVRAARAEPTLGRLRIVMVTGENDEAPIRACLDAGADGWIRLRCAVLAIPSPCVLSASPRQAMPAARSMWSPSAPRPAARPRSPRCCAFYLPTSPCRW